MAKVSNVNTRIYLDQYNLSGFLNAASLQVDQELIPVTCFSDTGPRRLVGNYDHKHDHTGLFDGDDDSVDEIIHALLDDDDHYLCELFGANVENSVAYESIVALTGKPLQAQLGQAILLNSAFVGRGGASRGLVIRNATISGNGDGTGRNIGASTAGQTFQTVIRVLSGTFTSFDVNIYESQNDGGGDPYALVADLSETGINAVGVWRNTTTSATEAWKRVTIANWIGTDAVLLVTAGIVQGT